MEEQTENQLKKMCVFCHAQVAMEAKICPFCRGHFDQIHSQTVTEPQKKDPLGLSEKQTIDSLYPPPYQPKMERIEEEEEVQKPIEENIRGEKVATKPVSALLPIFLFSLGSQLLIFSLFLFFFSQEGMLVMQWNSSLWYLYSILSIGMLFGGYTLFFKEQTE